ncbi:MAG: ribosome biogenesis GTPase Der [Deltaproteobacteria bacterium]|jgi:GTP-binding protein|nr:ribosome biogenesis GTPase Der [Deltaproteobacteria bacterium]
MSVIAILGRPNVGKSSLFNRLIQRSAALVDDQPGVTRDRHYGRLTIDDREGWLVDTGGFELAAETLASPINEQIRLALLESDLVILVVDGLLGRHPRDGELAELVRKADRPALLAVNKIDSPEKENLALEFHSLGFSSLYPVSAAHGLGVATLKEALYPFLEPSIAEPDENSPPRIAVVGRPNAGKSSLINHLCGQNRLVVDATPGTTRDAVDVTINMMGRPYILVDTAGVRRRGRVSEKLEKLSVLRALKSVEKCDLALLVVDASEGLADQDAHIAGRAFERGRPVVFLVNKWDLIKEKKEAREAFTRDMELKMAFLEKAPWLTVSALKGQGLNRLWPLVDRIMEQYSSRASTAEVNKVVQAAVEAHTPPYVGQGRLKFYYATQASTRPPSFVIFANRPDAVHYSYKRYLINKLKAAFKLDLIPARVFFRARHEDWAEKPKKKSEPPKTGPRKTGASKTGGKKAGSVKSQPKK